MARDKLAERRRTGRYSMWRVTRGGVNETSGDGYEITVAGNTGGGDSVATEGQEVDSQAMRHKKTF